MCAVVFGGDVDPEVELGPEQIQALIDGDRDDKKDLFAKLGEVDKACESCHLHYWYPNDKRAREAAKEDGIVD